LSDYRFINKDPIIDVIRTAMGRKGNMSAEQINRVAYDAGIHPGTLHNWLMGDTRRPLSITTRFVLEALGVTVKYADDEGKAIKMPEPEMISASEQRKILAADRERDRARDHKRKEA
jgi:hypothetical protein